MTKQDQTYLKLKYNIGDYHSDPYAILAFDKDLLIQIFREVRMKGTERIIENEDILRFEIIMMIKVHKEAFIKLIDRVISELMNKCEKV